MADLVVGAWRNGIDEGVEQFVNEVTEREGKHFRTLPHEQTIATMRDLLDAYDELATELLNEETPEAVLVMGDEEITGSGFTIVED